MNIIIEKIESIKSIKQQMNSAVNHMSRCVEKVLTQQTSQNLVNINKTKSSSLFKAIRNISLVAFFVGCLMFHKEEFSWTKFLFWGGLIGFIAGIIGNIISNNKANMNSSTSEFSSHSLSVQKQIASREVMSTIENMKESWDNLTRNNKAELLDFIDNCELSDTDKFNATSIISVTKTLDFELLKTLNLIENADSIFHLKDNIADICNLLTEKIAMVSEQQIESYKQVISIIQESH